MNKSYRVGAAAVIFAVILRICCSTLPQQAVLFLQKPEVIRLLLFAETGRWVELPRQQAGHRAESATPVFAQGISFTQEDALLVEIQNVCGKTVDVEALLRQPLQLDLTGAAPTVLILHTHGSESYTGDYVQDSDYRTLDENHNMLSIGQALAGHLEQAGIQVIQDRTLHDYPSYNGSYTQARSATKACLRDNPSVQLVLDLHRDAAEDRLGNQVAQVCSVNGQEAAKIMLVVGGGHENWESNMALALKLQARLEQLYPGICRPIAFRSQTFNQDLSGNALLIEIGSAGNTQQQALYTAQLLSQAIIDLQNGTTDN